MEPKRYRVVQWATGKVGQAALGHFIANPAFDLAGVYVTNPEKVGKDAGALVGTGPVGIAATDDAEAILALEADCVHFAPLLPDLDMVCRLLRSGKNVVSPLGPFYPTERYRADLDRIEAAAREGGVSFHGSGIHPGFAGDLLPLTLVRLMGRVDHVHVYEIVDHLANPSVYIGYMGFGRDAEALRVSPSRSPEAPYIFAQSMAMIVEALGGKIDEVTSTLDLALATQDIPYPTGVVAKGTVAGQLYEWTAWSGGRPLVTYHCVWKMGDAVDPRWDLGDDGYRIVIEGDTPLEMTLTGAGPGGRRHFPGLALTAMAGVTAIPAVCDAAPGIVTHLDLGVVAPRGLVRP